MAGEENRELLRSLEEERRELLETELLVTGSPEAEKILGHQITEVSKKVEEAWDKQGEQA